MTVLYFLGLWNTPSMRQAHYLQERSGAYLSRHGRLAGMSSAAAFSSEDIARLCLELWMPSLQARWGASFEAEVEAVTFQGHVGFEPSLDAATLLARGRSGRFASNQAVSADAIAAARIELELTKAG